MEKYKPHYLGKIFPIDDEDKQHAFIHNQFESFDKIYNICKEHSELINDVSMINSMITDNDTAISIQITANDSTISEICKKADSDDSIIYHGNIFTAFKK